VGAVDTDAQDLGRAVTSEACFAPGTVRHETWDTVRRRLRELGLRDHRVYGVPRNGMLLCALLDRSNEIVTHPAAATVILDDLIDSGATRDKFKQRYPYTPFVALLERAPGDPWVVWPWENETGPEDAVLRLLQWVGEDPKREGLAATPRRVVKALREMTAGMHETPAAYLETTFTSDVDEMVVVRDLPFSSLCEHHLLPFHGTVTIGYLPRGKVFGLSKLPRLVHAFARRLQLQEQFTHQIASTIMQSPAQPGGVGVIVRGVHTCMSARGVRSPGEMRTSALLGSMRDGGREEFLRLAGER
jgi:GTP cyclohydrolase I